MSMLIGIVSDSHDHMEALDKVVEIFNRRKVGLVIHAGDLISPIAASRLKPLKAPLKAVYGNNDGERGGLQTRFQEFDWALDDFLSFSLQENRFAIYHGTIPGIVDSLIKSGEYDVVVSGHTHARDVKNMGKVLHINPGEACGYLTGEKTVSLLDSESMEVETVYF